MKVRSKPGKAPHGLKLATFFGAIRDFLNPPMGPSFHDCFTGSRGNVRSGKAACRGSHCNPGKAVLHSCPLHEFIKDTALPGPPPGTSRIHHPGKNCHELNNARCRSTNNVKARRVAVYRAQVRFRPPSTAMISPVIQLERGPARNRMASATSSACPTRPKGCVVLLCSRNLS